MNIAEIISKKIDGSISLEEQGLLDEWMQESEENEALLYRLIDTGNTRDIAFLSKIDVEEKWEKTMEVHRGNVSAPRKVWQSKNLLKYAAIFIGALGLVFGYFQTRPSNGADALVEQHLDAITLELESGEKVVIAQENSRIITNAQGSVLGKQQGDKLVYTESDQREQLVYNTLKVPHGRRFSILLSDSTLVRMNSGSSLKYPVQFVGNGNRQVFLSGEAYFEVAKDKDHPFIVTSGDKMDVRVLGTKFNVAAYPEDKEIQTVLVEGSVSVYGSGETYDPASSNPLMPGHMATWHKDNGDMDVEQVETEIYTGWIDGKLVIKEMPFKNIKYKLERHYNVSIVNRYKRLDDEIFTATFDVESMEEVLKIFAEETPFRYEIKKDEIIIYEPSANNS